MSSANPETVNMTSLNDVGKGREGSAQSEERSFIQVTNLNLKHEAPKLKLFISYFGQKSEAKPPSGQEGRLRNTRRGGRKMSCFILH